MSCYQLFTLVHVCYVYKSSINNNHWCYLSFDCKLSVVKIKSLYLLLQIDLLIIQSIIKSEELFGFFVCR